MRSPGEDRPASRARRELFAFVELFAIAGLAFAQPVLDIFQDGADIFVLRRTTSLEIVVFTAILLLVPPAVLYLVELGVGAIWQPARRWLHALFLGALVALTVVEIGQHLDRPEPALAVSLGVAAAALAGTTAAVLRLAGAHTFFRLLAIAPALIAIAFLVTPPVSDITFSGVDGTTADAAINQPAPVLVIVFDELPTASLLGADGRIEPRLFPNFARLADDATWYRNHAGVSPTTPEAVPPILTGRYPDSLDVLPTSTAYPDNLFTLLGGAYELNVWDQVTHLCPRDLCPETDSAADAGLVPLLGDAVDVWSDWVRSVDALENDEAFKVRQSDPDAPNRFDAFIESMGVGDERLDYLHVLLPHQPWRYLPSGQQYNPPFLAEGLNDAYHWRSDYFAEAARQRHLLQLQLTDRLLGAALDRLVTLDRYDDTLIVVTADHGVAFDTGEPIRGASAENAEQVLFTPLLVKAPGQHDGAVDDRPVSTVDIVPTIADVLSIELPWEVDGRSVRDDGARSEARRYYRWERYSDLPTVEGEDYSVLDGEPLFDELIASGGTIDLEGDPEYWLYRLGPYGELVGRNVDDVEHGDDAPFELALDDPDTQRSGTALDYDDVDLGADILPTYVSGDVTTRDPVDLVVTVNGTIGGWARTFVDTDDSSGRSSFFALVPPSLLRPGDNLVEVFAVSDGAGGPRLHAVPPE